MPKAVVITNERGGFGFALRRLIYLAIRGVFCRNAISSFKTSIMRSNMLRSLPEGMRLYFVMSSESAPCRLRRSLSVLSMKSSMRVITAAQGWVAPVPSVGGLGGGVMFMCP